ncbi:MAG: NADP-dependent oxidoreductase [Rhodopila sp.]|nr:NADP-dependent oxidoreductase [Rhodopila sp.]
MPTSTFAGPTIRSSELETMKACRVHRFGPPNVLTTETIARPVPGEEEVLVRVKAAGVGPWDAWVRAGKSVVPQPLPLTLGSDLSGVAEAVGTDVTTFEPGDEVFGVTNARFTGAYAEYAIASAGMLAGKPSTLDDVRAASVPVVAVTAWQALFEQARVGPGQTVLIHGGAGNVGAFAVQLAKLAEARVIATASARDADYVRDLGADVVVNFHATRFEEVAHNVDVVIDLVGADVQARSFAVLRPGGLLVSTVSQPDQDLARSHGVRAVFFLVDVTTMHLTRLAEMIDAGELTTNVGAVLPLADARVAHEMLEGTRARPRGKIVLQVNA